MISARPIASLPLDGFLERVKALPIETWRYREEMGLGNALHLGPYAEDVQRIFNIGDGRVIPTLSMIGVCLMAIKELAQKVEELERDR